MKVGYLAVEASARWFALTMGRALECALLVRHAQWSLAHEQDGRARAAAIRFAQSGIDQIMPIVTLDDAFALANDLPLSVE